MGWIESHRSRGLHALMQTRLIVLRHAETARPDLIHGLESDVGLGESGLLQARLAGEALQRIEPSLLYTSGMLRARQTAAEIGRMCGLQPRVLAALHEQRMGILSGRAKATVAWAHQQCLLRWKSGDLAASLPDGESFLEIRDRVIPAIRDIAEECAGRTGVVVAHGVVIRVLIVGLCANWGLDSLDQLGIDFLAANDLRHDGTHWTAAALNTPIASLAGPGSQSSGELGFAD